MNRRKRGMTVMVAMTLTSVALPLSAQDTDVSSAKDLTAVIALQGLPLQEDTQVLDLCCGSGQTTQFLVQRSPSLAVINLLQSNVLDKDQYFDTYEQVAQKLKQEWPAGVVKDGNKRPKE